MTIAKKINTLCFQLESSMRGNEPFLRKVDVIKNEFDFAESSDKCITHTKRQQLNRVLHSTRAFDSGLRLFIEKQGRFGNITTPSIGGYIHELQQKRAGQTFRQLSGIDATNITNLITNERNKYMHVAGQFPTKAQADIIIGKILDYYQRILSLEF